MKHTGLVLLALIFVGGLVFAAGCIAAPATQSPEGKWILTGFGSGSTTENPMGIIGLEITGTNVSGNSGVNQYFGSITLDTATGKLTFGPLGTTRMAGPEGMMLQEQKYLAALANVTGYKITDGVLSLTDKDGKTLLTFAAMPAKTLEGTSWTLADNADVTIEFTNGEFAGSAPVNLYFGPWHVTGTNSIKVGPLGTSLMAGTDAQMKDETAFFQALTNVTGYKFDGSKLLLTGKDGKTLLTFNEASAKVTTPITGNWTLSTDKNVTLNFGENGSFNGQAPVNLYFGTITATGSTISFGDIGSTLMAGPENQMNAETAFFQALGNASSYEISTGKLTLMDKNGKTLLTFVQPVETITAKSLPGMEKTGLANEWTLVGNNNVNLNLTADGSVNGQAPVNRYFGSYTETDGKLSFGAVGSTMMAGPEDQMNAETAFFQALGNVAGYKVVDGKLHLTDAAGTTLLTFE